MTEQHDMQEVLRSGLPLDALESFAKTIKIPAAEIIKVLGMAPRTFARRKDHRVFTPAESDRLYRLARVASMIIQVLGSVTKVGELRPITFDPRLFSS